jgi:hypothetical protein
MLKKALIVFIILVSMSVLFAQRRQDLGFNVHFTDDIPHVHSMNIDPEPVHFQLSHVPGQPDLYAPAFQAVHYILTSTTPNATMRARLL